MTTTPLEVGTANAPDTASPIDNLPSMPRRSSYHRSAHPVPVFSRVPDFPVRTSQTISGLIIEEFSLSRPRSCRNERRAIQLRITLRNPSAPSRIRTCDLRIRSPALYPTELWAQHLNTNYYQKRPRRASQINFNEWIL